MAKKLDIPNPLKSGEGAPPPALSMDEAANLVYGGGLELPSGNKIIARPLKLVDIRPDMEQPRRIIPARIRKGWTGNPKDIERMLREWHVEAEQALGQVIDVISLVDRLSNEGREADKEIAPMVDDYLDLVALASSIKRDGLTNPITVAGDKIETGERRYMAHWLLAIWLPEAGFDAIHAVQVKNVDVWKQASENGNRKGLNAIGMARQLALLVMDMYRGDDGVVLYEIGFFDHEQQFYAQVANGPTWRVKKGYGERILQVTGLKSRSQVAQYRALLEIPRDVWDSADAENWAEGRIRDVVHPRDMSTIVNISEPKDGFDSAMRGLLKQAVYRQIDIGLYGGGKDRHIFLSWSGDQNCYQIKQVEFAGGQSKLLQPDVTKLIEMVQRLVPSMSDWRVIRAVDWNLLVNPPAVKVDAPPKVVDRATAFGELAGDYDEDEEGDEDDVKHPFEDGAINGNRMAYVPADVDAPTPKDERYVLTGSLLHRLLGMLIVSTGTSEADIMELSQFRDITHEGLLDLVHNGLSADEIFQTITVWGEAVTKALMEIKRQLAEAQDAIWNDVPKGDGE